jgi:hypothetical protein
MLSNAIQVLPRTLLLLGVASVMVWLSACGAPQAEVPTGPAQPPRVRYGTLDRNVLRAESVDINGDGTSDQVRWMTASGAHLMTERDLDFDGAADMYDYFEGNALVEQEFQLDFDRAIDLVVYYAGDRIVRKQMSTSFDGQFNLTKIYDASGMLESVERDSDGNGRVDVWEYYVQGTLSRVGLDTDGDGRPDSTTPVE